MDLFYLSRLACVHVGQDLPLKVVHGCVVERPQYRLLEHLARPRGQARGAGIGDRGRRHLILLVENAKRHHVKLRRDRRGELGPFGVLRCVSGAANSEAVARTRIDTQR